MPPFVIGDCQTATGSRAKANTGHLRGIASWHVLIIGGGPRKLPNCSHEFRWLPHPTQESAGSLSVQVRHHVAHTSHVKIIWFRFAVTIYRFPFARFIMSFVSSCFALIDISVSSLVSCKRWVRRRAYHHLPPVAHFAQTTRVNLDAIPTRTRNFMPAGYRSCSAVRLLFQLWGFIIYLYTYVFENRPLKVD